MSGPAISGKPGSGAWLKVLDHLWRAVLGFGLAWGCCWLARGDLWMFHIYAALCTIGGTIRLGKCLWTLGKLLIQRRKWARYEALGVAPKADPMAGTGALRDRGLLK